MLQLIEEPLVVTKIINLKSTNGHEVYFDSSFKLSTFINPNQVQTLQETTGESYCL